MDLADLVYMYMYFLLLLLAFSKCSPHPSKVSNSKQ